jgi:L,D-transpeptidase catalytic domain
MPHKLLSKRRLLFCASLLALLLAYVIDDIGLTAYYRVKFWTPYTATRPDIAMLRMMYRWNPFYDRCHAVLVNMKLPANAPRMQVLDLVNNEVVFKTRVMHGKRSGGRWAVHFSNSIGSNMTSLGRYVIVENYSGKFGAAYRLAGLDATNSNALSRSIVLHKSPYAGLTRIGRSEGCPAVSPEALLAMKPYLQKGTLVWLYN